MFFIPNNVPSLKNSKIKTSHGIFPSATVKKYLQKLGIKSYSSSKKIVEEYKQRPNIFKDFAKYFVDIEYPILIGFHFVRGTKHKFDFGNAVQILADLMTAHKFIEDDNMDCFIPFPMNENGDIVINNKTNWYSYNKEEPGVWIKIYE